MTIIHGPNFQLKCDDMFSAQGRWLSETIAAIPDLGDGTTIELGWTLLRLIAEGDVLLVHEPNFDGNAKSETRFDVTASLKAILVQSEFMKLGQEAALPTRFDDKVVLRKGCLNAEALYGERSVPSRGDSGWYFGPRGEAGPPGMQDLEAIWAYELVAARPELLAPLVLPAGWLVLYDGADLAAVVNASNEKVWPRDV